MFSYFIYFLLICYIKSSYISYISYNFHEINTISPFHRSGHVNIYLNIEKSCNNSKFVVRLSGLYLVSILPVTHINHNHYISHFIIYKPGIYQIEVLLLYCSFNELNFKDDILILDTKYLTFNSTYEYLTPYNLNMSFIPHWEINNSIDISSYKNINDTFLKTRTYWNKLSHNFTFNYDFKYLKKCPLPLSTNYNVCISGASHARVLSVYMSSIDLYENNITNYKDILLSEKYMFDNKLSSNSTRIKYIEKHFASDNFYPNIDCDILIITTGQWDLSWKLSEPTKPDVFRSNIKNIFYKISNSKYYNKTWILSCDPNSIGQIMPANKTLKDWRNPAVVDMYNNIIKEEVNKYNNIKYINLWPIVYPMWDSAPDYSHYINNVGRTMAQYIVNTFFHVN